MKSFVISLNFLPHDKVMRFRVFWDVTHHLVSVSWCLTSFRHHSASQFHNPAVQHLQQNWCENLKSFMRRSCVTLLQKYSLKRECCKCQFAVIFRYVHAIHSSCPHYSSWRLLFRYNGTFIFYILVYKWYSLTEISQSLVAKCSVTKVNSVLHKMYSCEQNAVWHFS